MMCFCTPLLPSSDVGPVDGSGLLPLLVEKWPSTVQAPLALVDRGRPVSNPQTHCMYWIRPLDIQSGVLVCDSSDHSWTLRWTFSKKTNIETNEELVNQTVVKYCSRRRDSWLCAVTVSVAVAALSPQTWSIYLLKQRWRRALNPKLCYLLSVISHRCTWIL